MHLASEEGGLEPKRRLSRQQSKEGGPQPDLAQLQDGGLLLLGLAHVNPRGANPQERRGPDLLDRDPVGQSPGLLCEVPVFDDVIGKGEEQEIDDHQEGEQAVANVFPVFLEQCAHRNELSPV